MRKTNCYFLIKLFQSSNQKNKTWKQNGKLLFLLLQLLYKYFVHHKLSILFHRLFICTNKMSVYSFYRIDYFCLENDTLSRFLNDYLDTPLLLKSYLSYFVIQNLCTYQKCNFVIRYIRFFLWIVFFVFINSTTQI